MSATWVSGNNVGNQPGTYGVKGTGSISNIPGGRTGSISWSDLSGNLWLFGGGGEDSAGNYGYLNDLWEYTPSNQKWTWVSGNNVRNQVGTYGTKSTGATTNIPGSRWLSISWTDTLGNLWLFGGYGYDSAGNVGSINDLWEYTLSNQKWTWVSGNNVWYQNPTYGTLGTGSVANTPGARNGGVTWIDSSGNLWLFGGNGLDNAGNVGMLNDLWEFTPGTLKWTWVSGNNTRNQSGVYGTLGVGSTSNIPGGREAFVSWIDSSGNFWLFGGGGYDSAGTLSYLNDLWKFNPSSLQWTWVSGNNIGNAIGSYGNKGFASTSNVPGARSNTLVSWVDLSGNFWIFGGSGYDSNGTYGNLNDCWMFNPSTLAWTWVGGGNIVNQGPAYGAEGIASASNIPGARNTPISWTDSSGNFWLFGGFGNDSTDTQTNLNDLWLMTLP